MSLHPEVTPQTVILTLNPEKRSFVQRVLRKQLPASLGDIRQKDRYLAFAIADLKALSEEHQQPVSVTENQIVIPHELVSRLDSHSAQVLGLPPLVDLTLKTDIEGALGHPTFKLRYEWLKNGQRQITQRTGAILSTSQGLRRLPVWMVEALNVVENFKTGGGDAGDWAAMAHFRQALDPGVEMSQDTHSARLSMSDFLQGLQINLADSFSLAATHHGDSSDFEVVPFAQKNLREKLTQGGDIQENDAELGGQALERFQKRCRMQGALPAYRVGEGHFLLVDPGAVPVLQVMTEKQRAPAAERKAFIENPRPEINAAIEKYLDSQGRLAGLDDISRDALIEAMADPVIVETDEYSARVIGLKQYSKPSDYPETFDSSRWLPEEIPQGIAAMIEPLDTDSLKEIQASIVSALKSGEPEVPLGDMTLPVTPALCDAIAKRITLLGDTAAGGNDPLTLHPLNQATIILDTRDNFEEVNWCPEQAPRIPHIQGTIPSGIRTALRSHQLESFHHQLNSWQSGMPGILNADEQGLGKTLQTITFLRWLQDNARQHGGISGPVLIVAPTSLLENWNKEVTDHCDIDGLGTLLPLYGSALSRYKYHDGQGVETLSGEQRLDLNRLQTAIREAKGHRFWLLTTYTTLTNYQHSFARIQFAAVVFDEIQALKNPVSLRAMAARAINAEYRIGLTGTPIENSTGDLWAVMDQITPGYLGSRLKYTAQYQEPTTETMQELYQRVFMASGSQPALAFRRLKDQVAKDLPVKTRYLHPHLMPEGQMVAYDNARVKLKSGAPGAALKMLQHIRGVSVHPALDMDAEDEAFISASARLSACFDILREIQNKQERVLVFIEHRKMQYRFIELVKQLFGMEDVDLINGDTPIKKRQQIVNRFQRHLQQDFGFDLLVLGPKAAGTGLTLTAATHVIHLSRWWNPAVEEQCNDRVHRIGQTKPVTVHIPIAIHSGYQENSFDCLLQSLMARKRHLAQSALWPMGETMADLSSLQAGLQTAENHSDSNIVEVTMQKMFSRDQQKGVERLSGSCWKIK
ncbi:DEAD/DEAH box helicase [Tatumella terrea]|uniref:DEAD/DEAH box helicase n=1 Tax=Tatumella terrea TaxID=419007 RepID=A0ABW1VZ53_9GAMM